MAIILAPPKAYISPTYLLPRDVTFIVGYADTAMANAYLIEVLICISSP